MATAINMAATYPSDKTRYDWLAKDWDLNDFNYINVQGDYTVALLPQGFYGIQLRHVQRQLSGNLKSIGIKPFAGGVELVQNPTLLAPGPGQYRTSPLPTGRIEFHSSALGQKFTAKYVSSGTVLNHSTIEDAIALDLPDIIWDGTPVNQRLIRCHSLHVTANTTVKCRNVIVYGDVTFDPGVIVTHQPHTVGIDPIRPGVFEPDGAAAAAGGTTASGTTSGHAGVQGQKGFDGLAFYVNPDWKSGRGGKGGHGGNTSTGQTGGLGGAASPNGAGASSSGGGGSGGGSGSSNTPSGSGGAGAVGGKGAPAAARVVYIAKGSFIMGAGSQIVMATQAASAGSNGFNGTGGTGIGTGGGGGGGGGGHAGGALLIVANGDASDFSGSISAIGGNGAVGGIGGDAVQNGDTGDGGDGGDGGDAGNGGFVGIAAYVSIFGTINVPAGSPGLGGAHGQNQGTSGAANGATGAAGTIGKTHTQTLVDISDLQGVIQSLEELMAFMLI